jgi:ribosomal protein S18 acetylase RimI-like enzyme
MLEACDIGHRVVVRHRVDAQNGPRPLYSDLLGTLVALDEERLVMRTDAGEERIVDTARVSAAKRVPPRPPRWSEMLELERIADRAWPAPVHERLGEWYLRAADGWTLRANSALPLGDPGCPLTEAVAACADWYTARGLPPAILVPLPVRRDVAAGLTAAGWQAATAVLVQTAPLAGLSAQITDSGVRLTDQPSPGFLERIAQWKSALPRAAHRVLAGTGPVAFAEVPDGAAPQATARGAIVDGWLHLGLVEVAPPARRRGLAQAVTIALASWAAAHGAQRALLQVEDSNEAAIALYRRLGFTTHHRYVTYRLPTRRA